MEKYPANLPEDIRGEWDAMLAGRIYDAGHPGFGKVLMATRKSLHEFNNMPPDRLEDQKAIIRGLLGSVGAKFHINQPFRCDYGCNIHIGDNFFANFNLTILDEARVVIGSHAFIGPNVSIYTACHPLDADTRNTSVEWAEPVTIGDNVWIGGGVTILPGVTIGDNCVIGAGAVVTHDIPADSVAAGNPAKVIRKI